jgi:DNA ligase-1
MMNSNLNEWKSPILYKRGSKKQLLQWQIAVAGNVITRCHGQVGGKIVEESETIATGKNVGHSNETTPAQQALAEAQSEVEKQISRKGYTADRAKAEAGGNDQLGVISPMLAQKHTERGRYIKWPCYGQPKLDGMRILASFDGEETELFSRERKPIVGVPHIAAAITARCKALKIRRGIFDGEAYNHELKASFGKIISMMKKLQPGNEIVNYCIYDLPSIESTPWTHETVAGFEVRKRGLDALDQLMFGGGAPLLRVETRILNNWGEAQAWFAELVVLGYEGMMLRNMEGSYAVGARSNDLQKVKEFDEDEFEILGAEEGTGKFAGLAIFVCRAANGKEFRCNPPGALNERELGAMRGKIGKKLTVQYFGLTDAEQVPRFPTGKAIRDYE